MRGSLTRSILACGVLPCGVLPCGVLLGALVATSFVDVSRDTEPDETPTAEEIEEAAELFGSSCAACHLPPNPDYATDRAWLAQVTDTA